MLDYCLMILLKASELQNNSVVNAILYFCVARFGTKVVQTTREKIVVFLWFVVTFIFLKDQNIYDLAIFNFSIAQMAYSYKAPIQNNLINANSFLKQLKLQISALLVVIFYQAFVGYSIPGYCLFLVLQFLRIAEEVYFCIYKQSLIPLIFHIVFRLSFAWTSKKHMVFFSLIYTTDFFSSFKQLLFTTSLQPAENSELTPDQKYCALCQKPIQNDACIALCGHAFHQQCIQNDPISHCPFCGYSPSQMQLIMSHITDVDMKFDELKASLDNV